MSDLIERAAAINAIRNATFSFTVKSDIDFANYRKVIQEIFDNVLNAQEKALNELPSAQPVLTCDGCRHIGIYDTDFPCNVCVRMEKDYYEPE